MYCKLNWDREFLMNNFDKKWLNTEYKHLREDHLFEIEVGLLPATQPHVEREIKLETLQDELVALEKKRKDLLHLIGNKRNEVSTIILSGPTTERKKYIRKCPNNTCQGFLSTHLKCDLCASVVCSECREIKGKADIDEEMIAAHVCDPQILESVKFIDNDTKPCPNCTSMIHKIEGCSQMFCTECHTAFNWQTLRIETGIIHNPHYFEWQRRTTATGGAARNPNDVLCGRELDNHFTNAIREKFIDEYNKTRMTNTEFKTMIFELLRQCVSNQYTLNDMIAKINDVVGDRSSTSTLYVYSKWIVDNIQNMTKKNRLMVFPKFMKLLNDLPIITTISKIKTIEAIIQRTIHIREVEIRGLNVTDRVSSNLHLRIAFMRNHISRDIFKRELQKKDKAFDRNTEHANVLRMYVSCLTDLMYRMYENLEEYEDIIKEIHELRRYTNDCLRRTFTVYGSSMNHNIDRTCKYMTVIEKVTAAANTTEHGSSDAIKNVVDETPMYFSLF